MIGRFGVSKRSRNLRNYHRLIHRNICLLISRRKSMLSNVKRIIYLRKPNDSFRNQRRRRLLLHQKSQSMKNHLNLNQQQPKVLKSSIIFFANFFFSLDRQSSRTVKPMNNYPLGKFHSTKHCHMFIFLSLILGDLYFSLCVSVSSYQYVE